MTAPFRICACAAILATAVACGSGSPVAPTPTTKTNGPDSPVVERIAPSTGSISGTRVTITGRGFRTGATVVIEEAAVGVVVVNSETITAMTPVLTKEVSAADVIVINPDEHSGRLASAFRYAVVLDRLECGGSDRQRAAQRDVEDVGGGPVRLDRPVQERVAEHRLQLGLVCNTPTVHDPERSR